MSSRISRNRLRTRRANAGIEDSPPVDSDGAGGEAN